MLAGDETVECQISCAAMDDLDGTKGTHPADRKDQFLRLREEIERIASTTFDERTVRSGQVLRFFSSIFENESRARCVVSCRKPATKDAAFLLLDDVDGCHQRLSSHPRQNSPLLVPLFAHCIVAASSNNVPAWFKSPLPSAPLIAEP
jgi:hypothetical protein